MTTRRRLPHALWAPLALFALIALSDSPLFKPLPGLDAGVYGYIGQRILAGDWPYRDVFDHKPPLIYAVNALGLWLGGGSLWGVWLLLSLWMGAALALAARVLRRAFGDGPAAVGLLLLGGSFVLVGDFNRPEALALLPQFGALALIQRARMTARTAALLGVLAAIALLLKHNVTALWLAIGLLWLLEARRTRRWFPFAQHALAATLAGSALVATVLGLFWRADALPALWDALVRFNLAYIGQVGWAARAAAVVGGLELLAAGGLLLPALAGWLLALARLTRRAAPLPDVVTLALLALPLELLLAGLAGQGFAHYYLPWLPVLTLLATWLLAQLAALWQTQRSLALALLLAATLLPAARLANRLARLGGGGDAVQAEAQTVAAAAAYLRANSAPAAPVLVWGGASNVYLLAQRRAPVRMHYQYPLYLPGYQSATHVEQFVAELTADPPVLIIVNWPPGADEGGFIAGQARFWATFDAFDWYPLVEMRTAYRFVEENYRFVTVVGPHRWAVYARIAPAD